MEGSDQLGGTETRGKAKEVLVACSMFDPEVFKMRDGVLMFKKAANRNWMGEVRGIFSWTQWCQRFGVYAIKVTVEDIEG